MKQLTVEFIEEKGFKKKERVHEDEFYYDEYIHSTRPDIVIWFNYFNDGSTSYDVEFCCFELKRVGQDELQTLLNIL